MEPHKKVNRNNRQNLLNCFLVIVLLQSCAILFTIFSLYDRPLSVKKQSPTDYRSLSYLPRDLVEYIRVYRKETSRNLHYRNAPEKSHKIILLYNSYFGVDKWGVGEGTHVFTHQNCPVKTCIVTDEKSLYDVSDAVLFHFGTLPSHPPAERPEGQRWVFYTNESPVRELQRALYSRLWYWNGLFNWTATYRLDSDAHFPYGEVRKTLSSSGSSSKNYTQVIQRKSKLIAAIVSNCHTQSMRADFIKELARYIPVDVYGYCGTLPCPGRMTGPCMDMINHDYKFYLAAENSFCKDYVTEKLYKILPLDVVPVVRGGANYSNILPHGIYIDSGDFHSVKALAEYLLFLNNNTMEYIKYLSRKNGYSFVLNNSMNSRGWCDLCEKLNQKNQSAKYYEKIDKWWSLNDCIEPPDRSQIQKNILSNIPYHFSVFKKKLNLLFNT